MKIVAGTFSASSELNSPRAIRWKVAEIFHLIHGGSVVDCDCYAARMCGRLRHSANEHCQRDQKAV